MLSLKILLAEEILMRWHNTNFNLITLKIIPNYRGYFLLYNEIIDSGGGAIAPKPTPGSGVVALLGYNTVDERVLAVCCRNKN